jgi:NMD protein affecting ribosome stability and mRNA decay
MNKFNPDAICPKCGHDKIASTWKSCDDVYVIDKWVTMMPERITRRCERCSFAWDELPIDKE